uniref:transmembrane 4 L6 family member 4-like isoform X1 n=1 Tax=Pristiophorus japonicus TaxID=55135 RepID=UPI00398E5478
MGRTGRDGTGRDPPLPVSMLFLEPHLVRRLRAGGAQQCHFYISLPPQNLPFITTSTFNLMFKFKLLLLSFGFLKKKQLIFPIFVFLDNFIVLFPAMHFLAISKKQYCGERCGMCLSVLFALISVLGATYCFGISALGLIYGPFCQHSQGSRDLKWGRPFEDNLTEFGPGSYLFNQTLWSQCIEPKNIVLFNLVLFTVQLGSSAIEVFLCFIQMINGLVGCICGERRRPQR